MARAWEADGLLVGTADGGRGVVPPVDTNC